jgi:hypothetical protein
LLDTLLNCLTDEADIHKLTLYWNWFYDKFITFVQNGYVFNIYINPGFAPGFVNNKKGCTQLAAASDQVYQLLAHDRWFSPGTPAFSTTKTDRHDIAEISAMLKM